jgi:BolA protein
MNAHAEARDALAARLASLAPRVLEIRDDSQKHAGHAGAASGAGHFSLTIVSEHFLGLTRLARHRAILERVGDLIPYPVHALSIEAHTPDEIRRDERTKQ